MECTVSPENTDLQICCIAHISSTLSYRYECGIKPELILHLALHQDKGVSSNSFLGHRRIRKRLSGPCSRSARDGRNKDSFPAEDQTGTAHFQVD
jgi:hypothetical protein